MAQNQTLRSLLMDRKVNMQYRKEYKFQTWMPTDAIEDIFGSDEGQRSLQTLPGDADKLWSFANKSKCLWALLVYVNRVAWLQFFYDASFDDSLFPIRRSGTWKLESCRSEKFVVIPSQAGDDEMLAFDNIESQQWLFFVPIFGPNSFSCDFDYHHRMPFIREFHTEETNFSTVTEFVIHRKHLELLSNEQIGTVVDEDENPHIALKEVTSAHSLTRSKFEQLVKNEASVLVHFGKQDHPHFIQTIARYTHGPKHFFIFPWAKGGNLRNLWNKQPSLSAACASLNFSENYGVDYIRWFFEQLVGLSGAIEKLHYPPKDPGRSCRHGDLKPENILCFCRSIPEAGDLPTDIKLVVADAGHARIHEKATDLRGEQTTTPAGTQAYMPPEVESQSKKARPRRYDIWSLGCLSLEFLIWILYGIDGLEAFHGDVKRSQPYTFYRKDPEVSLKPEVQAWIEEIKKDPRCSPIMSTAVGRLIDLIEKRLLIVNIGAEATEDPPSTSANEESTSTPTSTPTHPEPLRIMIRKATIDLDQTRLVERAHADEMLEEMEKIVKAASVRGPRSLAWINWDGMVQAAERGTPRPTNTLSLTGHASLGVQRGHEGASSISERMVILRPSPQLAIRHTNCQLCHLAVVCKFISNLNKPQSTNNDVFGEDRKPAIGIALSSGEENLDSDAVCIIMFIACKSKEGALDTLFPTRCRFLSTLVSQLDNNWKYEFDDNTARKVVLQGPQRKEKNYRNSRLCQRCQRLRILSPNGELYDDLASLATKSQFCELCHLVYESMTYLAARRQETVRLVRSESGLSIVSGETHWGPVLSLCTTSESTLLRSSAIQPGFPYRLDAGSTTHINVLSEWIGDCNQTHHCIDESNFNPTRLLYIGEPDSRKVRLVTDFQHQKPVQYAALSHRWGPPDQKPPATVRFAATTRDNLKTIENVDGIEDGALPETFQDAVTVTRNLRIQYLWIDSLCILQKTGKGDDTEHNADWKRESLLMEKVFSSAYFTIAASCAQHRFDGFLKQRRQRDFVTMTASDGAKFHVCQVIDDFDQDVEQGELNKRGWVLQERALSRRTIHFTETQTYWECGKGIKCETFTKTENLKAAFLGDSNFPHSVEAFKHGRQIQHYQGLYERYSSLGLSHSVDRPIAIAGLEQRLMTALKSTGGYGIFHSNFHRDLLWHRQHGRPTLKRIAFGKSTQVPSWSWMGFDGGMRYMNAPLGGVVWNRKVISPFKVPHGGSSNTFEAQHPVEFQAPVFELKGERPELLLLDEPSRQLDHPLKCVVIGSNKGGDGKSRQHYAIILSPILKSGSRQVYERAGVAYLTEKELGNVENEQETETGIIR